jgi:hypothetical protein
MAKYTPAQSQRHQADQESDHSGEHQRDDHAQQQRQIRLDAGVLQHHAHAVAAQAEEQRMAERDHAGEAEHQVVAHHQDGQREDLDQHSLPVGRGSAHDGARAALDAEGAGAGQPADDVGQQDQQRQDNDIDPVIQQGLQPGRA